MTEQLSRRSLLKMAPAGAIGAAAFAAAATQATAASLDPSQPQNGLAAHPPLSPPVHTEYVQLDERATDPTKVNDHTLLFARTDGQVYSRDDADKVWPVSERVYDVRAYGAKGNGTVDDRAAIQAAINAANAAGGGIIEFGDVTYTYLVGTGISSGEGIIFLKPNQIYRGAATIRQAASSSVGKGLLFLDGSSGGNVRIEGLTIDGNKGNGASSTGIFIAHNNPNVVVRNVKVLNTSAAGIAFGNVATGVSITGARIEGCVVDAPSGHGIRTQVCPGIIIRGNVVRNTAVDANGIWCGDDSDEAIITDNFIENSDDMGIEVYSNNAVGGVVVANNRIHSVANMGISISGSPNTAVTGNVLTDIGKLTGGALGIEVAGSSHVAVAGNTIKFPTTLTPSTPTRNSNGYKGMTINDSSYVSVTGGTIEGGDVGIRVTSGSDYVNISGLVMKAPFNNGIELAASGLMEYLSIHNNKLIDVGKIGIEHTGGSLSHLSICDNTISVKGDTGINGLWIKPSNHNLVLSNNIITRGTGANNQCC